MSSSRFNQTRFGGPTYRRTGGGGPRVYNGGRWGGPLVRRPGTAVEPSLRKTVYTLLAAAPTVVALVGTRIYPNRPPATWKPAAGPCLIFEVSSERRDADLDGLILTASADVEVSAIAATTREAERILLRLLRSLPTTDTRTVAGLVVDCVLPSGETESIDWYQDGSDVALTSISQTFTILYEVGGA